VEDRRQEQVNEAAEKFAEALKDSYRALSERGVATQEQGAQLTENFFNRVIDNLRTQAEDNRAMAQQGADNKQRAEEAKRMLAQESVGVYMDFVNSLFSMSQAASEAAKRGEERSR